MTRMQDDTRVERDALGEVRVDAARYWGAQTERARTHFPIGRARYVWGPPMIRALAQVKRAAAVVNAELGTLDADVAAMIVRAADEVVGGRLDGEFPLVVFQTGSGTQTNMNVN